MGCHLDRGVAVFLDQALRARRQFPGCGSAGTLIYTDFVAALAANQHINGQARGLARDIPQRVLDAANRGINDRAAGKARELRVTLRRLYIFFALLGARAANRA